MADIASIIANIDGYRTYEQNRALDLQNEAAQMANAQNKEIWDLKRALAEQTPSLFEKWSYFDPQSARQKQFSDEQQLKMASTWANSIKNLAPENRAQGYNQFLRKMRAYGIDVSDMPQAYDEGYINQLAELGIDPETRYANEQTNMRQERQIEAQREARQDEFNKKLQAFDYENNYRTAEEKRRLEEKDNFVKALGYDEDITNSLLAANRGITTPAADEVMLSRLNNNPQDVGARTYFANKAQANQYIKDLTPQTYGMKEMSEIGKNFGLSANPDALNEGKIEFITKPQSGTRSFEEKLDDYNKLGEAFPQMSEADKIKMAFGNETYAGAAYGEGLKAAAKSQSELPALIERDNNQSQNRINENIIGQNVADKIKRGQMLLKSDIDKDFEQFKKNLPVDSVVQADQIAQRLQQQGYNITSTDILKNQYEKDVWDNLQKQAQIAQTQANTQKTMAETADIGNTNEIKNAKFIAENPQMAESPAFQRTGTTVNIDQKAEGEYSKQMAKQNAEAVKEYRKAANDATSTIYSIDNMIKAIKSDKVYQGTGGEMVNAYKKLLKSLGKDVKGMDEAAILDSGKSLLLGKIRREVMSGTTSDRDINFLVNMVPSLGKTKEQNLAIANMYKKTYQRQADIGKFVNNYIKQNGRWDENGESELNEFMNNPIFTDEEKQIAAGMPATPQIGQIKDGYRFIGGNPANPQSWEKM